MSTQPVITPLPGSIVLKLGADGVYDITLGDVATVSPMDNVTITISPQKLTCADLGAQTITVTAQGITADPTAASFNTPTNLLVDASGNIVIADNNNDILRYISKGGKVTTMHNGDGSPYSGSSGGQSPKFGGPNGLAMDKDGNIYVAESDRDRVTKLTPGGDIIEFTGYTRTDGVTGEDGDRLTATFYDIHSMIADKAGNLYVTEGDNKIRKVAPDGSVTTLVGQGILSDPEGITIDAFGNLYVADAGNNAIRKVASDGSVSTLAGGPGAGSSDGTGTSAQFDGPMGIAIDAQGNLYIADEGNGSVRKVTPAGVVSTLLKNAGSPRSIGIDGSGNLYFIDGDLIKKISPEGAVSPYAGGGTGSADGDISSSAGPPVVKQIPVTVTNDSPTPVVALQPSTTAPVCAGTKIEFTVSSQNTGISPEYNWFLNGVTTGETGMVYSSTAFKNNDKISCTVTFKDAACATPRSAASDEISLSITDNVSATVTIAGDKTLTCPEETVTFTATATNEGVNPAFNWFINGHDTQKTGAVFPASGLADGDEVTCTLLSDAPCLAPPAAIVTSDRIKIHITQPVKPDVVVAQAPPSVCEGDNILFTATINNTLTAPSYNWRINGKPVKDSNSPTFSVNGLKNGDMITCMVHNNAFCPDSASSIPIYAKIEPLPVITYPKTYFIQAGGSVKLVPVATQGIASYLWTGTTAGLSKTTIADPLAGPSITTQYTIIVTSSFGCTATAQVTVVIAPLIKNIPSAFTPNGDGANDLWNIPNLIDYPDCRVRVFNRLGQVVFSATGYTKPWDGTYKGVRLPAGVYYYTIDPLNNKALLSGSLTIIY